MSFTTEANKILNIFYTYVISVDSIPKYVGKGKGPRCYHHFEGKNHFANHLRKAQRENKNILIEKIIENVTEEEAFKKEKELIASYGRRDLKTGTLFNKTNGGDGVSGKVYSKEEREILSKSGKMAYANRDPEVEKVRRERISKGQIGKIVSEQTRKNISKAKTGNTVISQETRDKISKARKGHPTSKETRDKISKANKGRDFSKEHRERIGMKSRGRIQPESHRASCRERTGEKSGRSKLWVLRSPEGKEYSTMHMSAFCKEYNLAYSSLRERAQTKNQRPVQSGPSKGWVVVSYYKRELPASAKADLDFSND